jgi:L-lysine 6-transaminase
MWSHQHFDVKPDFVGFGKKSQVCGMMAGPRIDDESENVFHVSSRLNSTWGGNLVDMVRCQRYLEIMEEERLVERAAQTGRVLVRRLEALQGDYPDVLASARGRGLMAAVDAKDGATRDAIAAKVFEFGAVLLGSGVRSLRFRPPLDITEAEIEEGVAILRKAVEAVRAT